VYPAGIGLRYDPGDGARGMARVARITGAAMNNRLPLLAAIALVLALAACGPRVSQENYERIREDMSTQEVNAILGKPTEVSSFSLGGLSATTAKWVGKTHTITVTFANEKVKMKTLTENSPPEGN
jgi:outer membrane protein assembly factor BamE (lipoprotein component of BamABCDE complex)